MKWNRKVTYLVSLSPVRSLSDAEIVRCTLYTSFIRLLVLNSDRQRYRPARSSVLLLTRCIRNLLAVHDVDEKPDENQPNVQQETEPEGEIVPSTPEEVADQPKVETVESVPVIPDEKGAGKDRKKKSNRKKKSQQKDRALMSLM